MFGDQAVVFEPDATSSGIGPAATRRHCLQWIETPREKRHRTQTRARTGMETQLTVRTRTLISLDSFEYGLAPPFTPILRSFGSIIRFHVIILPSSHLQAFLHEATLDSARSDIKVQLKSALRPNNDIICNSCTITSMIGISNMRPGPIP